MRVTCPGCKGTLNVPDDRLGTLSAVRCGRCKLVVQLLEEDPGAAPLPDPERVVENLALGHELVDLDLSDLDLSGRIFERPVRIAGCRGGALNAAGAVFGGGLDLSGSRFAGEVVLTPVIEPDRRGGLVHGDLVLTGARLVGGLNLSGLEVTGTVLAEGMVVGRRLEAPWANFHGGWRSSGAELAAVRFNQSVFGGPADFSGARCEGEVFFLGAILRGFTDFASARFAAEVDLLECTFEEEVRFDGASFAGRADFQHVHFASCEFQGTRFDGALDLESSIFEGWADFRKARCSREVNLAATTFGAGSDFQEVDFCGDLTAGGARFDGDVFFTEARFAAPASFNEARFAGRVDLQRIESSARIDFSGAVFARSTYLRDAHLGGPLVLEETRFAGLNADRARFAAPLTIQGAGIEEARFERALIEEGATFDGALIGPSSFAGSRWQGEVRLQDAVFEGSSDWSESEFHGDADFSGARFAGPVRFDGVEFRAAADFRGCEFAAETSLAGALMRKEVDFSTAVFAARLVLDETRCEGKTGFAGATFAGPVSLHRLHAPDLEIEQLQIEGRIEAELERDWERAREAYGLLRKTFESLNRYDQMDWAYYRFKVMERRTRSAASPLRWLDQVIFDWGSGYGTRPLQLLATAAIFILLFAILFTAFEGQLIYTEGARHDRHSFLQYVYFSAVTFTTMGFGDFVPAYHGSLKYVVALEAFLGLFLMALFVSTYTRKVIRN